MPDLISPYQTAFIKGRQISENFNATRELLHHISDTRKPAVLVKIDFAKAFDSVEWVFLFRVLAARGFSQRWMNWVSQILKSASSRVVINGEVSAFFQHRRGLRQGDPLSPLLFNLAVDVLQKMVRVANANLYTNA
ncbi:secreted RxLR effector protein 78-like [Carex rostrata]